MLGRLKKQYLSLISYSNTIIGSLKAGIHVINTFDSRITSLISHFLPSLLTMVSTEMIQTGADTNSDSSGAFIDCSALSCLFSILYRVHQKGGEPDLPLLISPSCVYLTSIRACRKKVGSQITSGCPSLAWLSSTRCDDVPLPTNILEGGQHMYLCIASPSFRCFFQIHPFTVISYRQETGQTRLHRSILRASCW